MIGGKNIPKNRDGKGIPSLFRDGKQIPSLFRDGKKNSVSIYRRKIVSVSKIRDEKNIPSLCCFNVILMAFVLFKKFIDEINKNLIFETKL